MRIVQWVTLYLALFLAAQCLYADGFYVPKIDPRSRAQDLTEPTQKAVIVHVAGIQRLILQVSYKGSVSEFAWLVPTPSKPEVDRSSAYWFEELHQVTAPRWKYWFDADRVMHDLVLFGAKGISQARGPKVEVLERKLVGIYDISVLHAADASALIDWLRENGYRVTPAIAPALADYIQRGWVFTAMRVNTRDQQTGPLREGVLHPIELVFETPQPVYPLKISSLNPGSTNILLYVLAAHRVDAPPLRTVCVLDDRPAQGKDYMSHLAGAVIDDLLRSGWLSPAKLQHAVQARTTYITKLAGDLRPEQMTLDLIPRPAKANTVLIPYVSPPFLENVGAVVFLVIAAPFTPPLSLGALLICWAIAFAPPWRRRSLRWRQGWLLAGLLAIPACLPALIVSEIMHEIGYWPLGALAILLVVVGGLLLTARIRWRTGVNPFAARTH